MFQLNLNHRQGMNRETKPVTASKFQMSSPEPWTQEKRLKIGTTWGGHHIIFQKVCKRAGAPGGFREKLYVLADRR